MNQEELASKMCDKECHDQEESECEQTKKTDVENLIDSLPLPSVAWDW